MEGFSDLPSHGGRAHNAVAAMECHGPAGSQLRPDAGLARAQRFDAQRVMGGSGETEPIPAAGHR